MYIGNPYLFIGAGNWWVGSSLFPPADTTDGSGEGDGTTLFIFRATNRNILTALELGAGEPTDSLSTTVNVQYRGYHPIKILGFYIIPTGQDLYAGTTSPSVDYDRLIRWADDFTGALVTPGTPGLELTQVNIDTNLEETYQFKSGQGDASDTPVPYRLTTDGRLERDQSFDIKLTVNIPDDSQKKVLSSNKFDFTLGISYIEIPAAQRNLPGGDEC